MSIRQRIPVAMTSSALFFLLARPNGAGAAIPKRLLDDAASEQLREHLRDWSPDKGANLARVLTAAS